jgi:ankyrin repeat protein
VAKLTEFRKVSVLKKNYGFFQRGIQGQFTPIHCACINPNPEFLIKLLEMQPELNLADDQLRKPVHYAAACSGPGPLRHLIDQGIDTREGDKRKITPLMISSQYGRAQNVALLLQQKN